MTIDPTDVLKYVLATIKSTTEWVDDSIGESGCGHGHDTERDALSEAIRTIEFLTRQTEGYGHSGHYADGRLVRSHAQIAPGVWTSHVWHPNPTHELSRSWTGNLPHDPGTPSPGVYEVSANPVTQGLHVCVIKPFCEPTTTESES